VVSPSTLTFNLDSSAALSQTVQISTNPATNPTIGFVQIKPPWVTVAPDAGTTLGIPGVWRVTIDRAAAIAAGATTGTVRISGPTGLASADLTINLTGTGVGSSFSPSVSSLAFNESNASTPQTITFSSNTGITPSYTLTLAYQNGSNWLNVNPTPGLGPYTGPVTVSANPAGLGAGTYQALLTAQATNIAGNPSVSILITLTVGQVSGSTLTASPSILTFTYPVGTTTTQTQSMTVSSTPATGISFTTSSTFATGVSVTSSGITPATVTVSVNPLFFSASTLGYITLTPATAGYASITVPVQINPQGATGNVLTASPNQALLSTAFPSQFVTVSTNPSASIEFTYTISSNLTPYLQVTANRTVTPASLTLTAINPQTTPAETVGTITLTPAAGSGYTGTAIAVGINSQGTNVGVLRVTPANLTFNAVFGGGNPTNQTLSVTSTDVTQPFFTATQTSTPNFLTVTPAFSTTPSTVSVFVNTAAITQPGTYTGTITLTPASSGGVGTGTPVTVPVTLNVAPNITLTPVPSSLSLTAASGSSPVQQTVQLNVSSGNPAFTTRIASSSTSTSWITVSPSTTTLPAVLTVSANPANLSPGTYTATIEVLVQNAVVGTIPVTLTVTQGASMQVSPATLTFNHQIGTTAPAAQSVQITSGGGVLNWTATTSTSWIQVTPASGATPGTLNISINPAGLTAGSYTGSVSVASSGASNSPQTINVSLTVTMPVLPQVTSVTNGASFSPTVASPGLIFSVFGTDLGPATGVAGQPNSQGVLDTTLSETRVLFDGIPAPMLYTSSTQVSGVMPFELQGRFSTRMQVEYRGQRSRDLELRVSETSPGIFTLLSNGSGQGAILNETGVVNSPNSPAQRGSVVAIYLTGQGQTNPSSTTGRVVGSTPLLRTIASVTVRIGGQPAEVQYSGAAPGLISGAVQINARISPNAATGSNVPVEVTIGGASSQGGVTMAVQ
jgi:uncharacterized protein (TIGR03437 family)